MTSQTSSATWQHRRSLFGSTNYTLECEGFYISFNPNPGNTVFGSVFASDGGGPETALCNDGAFFILNGDYRDAYERLAPEGFDACKKFYDQQAAHAQSSWSNTAPAV